MYKVLSQDNQVYAIKHVKLKDLPKHVLQDYINEVKILRKLQGKPGIITLFDYEIDKNSKTLKIVPVSRYLHVVNGIWRNRLTLLLIP